MSKYQFHTILTVLMLILAQGMRVEWIFCVTVAFAVVHACLACREFWKVETC